jgi:predicted nucleic acid-binding protein
MSVFADSSALVKLYADEPGCELVRDIPVMVVAQIAQVEVPSAIWLKQRSGEFSEADAALLVADFEADYHGSPDSVPRFAVVNTMGVILEAAARIARRHRLRGFDSIQLASAILAAEAAPEITEFAVWDKQLRRAASAEGFTLIPA